MSNQMIIHVLSESLANKIAAGEVIERPASVIKELVENAIDAQATRIDVYVQAAGLRKIQVVDDGYGMSRDDLRLSLTRHATSKISNDQDLEAIYTLGFRGEALPSIAAVSHIEMVTRKSDDLAGTRLIAKGGKITHEEETGAPPGTSVAVVNLFYNTPARKEFLKAASAENTLITEMMTRFSLSHPNIAFKLVNDNQEVFHSSGQNRRIDVIATIYGNEIARKMLPLHRTEEGQPCSLDGYIAPPDITRGNRKQILTFINGRWIKSPLLENAVMKGYDTLLPLHRFPVSILHVTVQPQEIDVNVHPAKMEVRFHDEDRISEFITDSIRKTLLAQQLIPEVYKKTPGPIPMREEQSRIRFQEYFTESERPKETAAEYYQDNDQALTADVSKQSCEPHLGKASAVSSKEADDYFSILGQIFATYILIEKDSELLIVDQHAAQERVLYEKLTRNIRNQIPAQQLLVPHYLDLTPSEQEVMRNYENAFHEVGFDCEMASGRSLIIRAVPSGLSIEAAAELLRSVLEDITDGRTRRTPSHEQRETVIRAACRASVKAHDRISSAESRALFNQLLQTDNPYTCPHGRPTMVRFSESELERMFKRT